MKLKYTDEQGAVIECPDKNIRVNAFAGSGKTSMLVGYAEARPKARFLYVSFNSAIAAEARGRFPKNVDCSTSHSIAYKQFGAMYRHKLGNPRAKDAVEYLRAVMNVADMGRDQYFFAQLALRRVTSFFAKGSTDPDISDDHDGPMDSSPSGEHLNPGAVTHAARLLWAAMKDPGNRGIPMSHDGYLKLFQLSKPELSNYDIILLDEAQDTNPCLLNIIKNQKAGKVVVGDRHQNIYSFRGTKNALEKFDGTKLSLTCSFRFGPEIASIANAVLETFCGETLKIRGLSTDVSKINSQCYLHRTNAGLFDKAVHLYQKNEKLHFIGGVKNYQFDSILDTWKLSIGLASDIRDPFIRRFSSFADLADYAESVDDREIKSRMKIVMAHGSSIPIYVNQLNNSDTLLGQASAVLGTGHKVKGLEFDRVFVGDDFPELMMGGLPRTPVNAKLFNAKPLDIGEANLAYVVYTRAKKELIKPPGLAEFMKWHSEYLAPAV